MADVGEVTGSLHSFKVCAQAALLRERCTRNCAPGPKGGKSGETDHGPRIIHNTAEGPIATHFIPGRDCFQSKQLQTRYTLLSNSLPVSPYGVPKLEVVYCNRDEFS